MWFILTWVIYGLIVGLLAKAFHSGDDPIGFLPTVGIGIVGSYVGGFISWLLGMGVSPFEPSGIIMGVIGGVIFCWLYHRYRLNFLEQNKQKDKEE